MQKKCLFLTAACALLLDQAAKHFARGMASIPLIGGFLTLRYVENTGMSLGLWQGGAAVLSILTVLLIVLFFINIRKYALSGFAQFSAGLMLGGAVGNLIDRVLYGYVIDMIDVRVFVFNPADAALCIGTALMAFILLFRAEDIKRK